MTNSKFFIFSFTTREQFKKVIKTIMHILPFSQCTGNAQLLS